MDKRGGPIPYNVEGFSTPDAPKVVPLEQNYRIAPLDTLSIRVFKMTDLTGDYEVDLTGKISMPLIGEMSAVDLTTAERPAPDRTRREVSRESGHQRRHRRPAQRRRLTDPSASRGPRSTGRRA